MTKTTKNGVIVDYSKVKFEIILPETEKTAELLKLGAEQESNPSSHANANFIGIIELALLATGIGVIAKVIDFFIKKKETGVLIDSRTTPATITSVKSVPQGTVITINKNGTTTTTMAPKGTDLTEFVQSLLEKLGSAS